MIIQVGPYPPPIGGISMFIKRMKFFLDANNIENEVWDYSRIRKTQKNVINTHFLFIPFHFIKRKDVDIIHFHIPGMMTKRYISFFNKFFFKKINTLITLHGDCTSLSKKETLQLIKYLKSFTAIICVKQEDKDHLISFGLTNELYVIPAFLTPIVNKQDIDEINQDVWDFINTHTPIISVNASSLITANGQDVYGIDLCVNLCNILKKEYPTIGFVFCIPHIEDGDYFIRMKKTIKDLNLEENIKFVMTSTQLYPIILKSHIFVRPTNTDGDAVSIREALYFKIPTVTSDVVERPTGTIVFKNRDLNDFVLHVKKILNNYEFYKKNLENLPQDDPYTAMMNIYKKYM